MSPTTVASPTARQMSYLRSLAMKTGTSFSYRAPAAGKPGDQPATRTEDTRRDARIERHERDSETLAYATAVQDEEVSGYGASAAWRASGPPPRAAAAPKPARGGEWGGGAHRARTL